ncbi:hypothetical protein V1512DRAFT_267069 [Lipomyces arxii]|uniref:uncharacterized protein n=1 Tax=Lipomyces arxii TaxID=56418 RepID=UPI0034CED0DE
MSLPFGGKKKRYSAAQAAALSTFGETAFSLDDGDTLSPEELRTLDSYAWLSAFDDTKNNLSMRMSNATTRSVLESYHQNWQRPRMRPPSQETMVRRLSRLSHLSLKKEAPQLEPASSPRYPPRMHKNNEAGRKGSTLTLYTTDDVSISSSSSSSIISSSSRLPTSSSSQRFSPIPEHTKILATDTSVETERANVNTEMESTKIFERQVQDLSTPSHHHHHHTTENLIPPVLAASCEALTDDTVDPDSVQVVTVTRPHSSSLSSIHRSPSTASLTTGSTNSVSTQNIVSPANRLSFYSYADVVHVASADTYPDASNSPQSPISPVSPPHLPTETSSIVVTTLADAIRQHAMLEHELALEQDRVERKEQDDIKEELSL